MNHNDPNWVPAETQVSPSTEQLARFWSRVDKTSSCWLWRGGTFNSSGYALMSFNGRQVRAHRMAYMLIRGAIPDRLILDHLCRNRACVNPDHLEAVSNKTNVLRGVSNQAINARKTHCANGHEFTSENTSVKASGRRNCRTCSRAQAVARYKARKDAAA